MNEFPAERYPQIRIRKNVLRELKDFAARKEQENGARFSMSAFASDAILFALGRMTREKQSTKETEAV